MSRETRTVVIATVAPLWTIHYASELELVADHLSRGDDVHILTCRGGLAGCTANPTNDRLTCVYCRSSQRRALRAVGIPASHVHAVPHTEVADSLPVETLDELRDFDPDGSGAGRAAVSSLVSHLRDPEPDITKHDQLARQLLSSAQTVFKWTRERLDSLGADLAYVFNGRYVNALPTVRAARQLAVPIIAHERNWNATGFITRESGSVHSLEEWTLLLSKADHEVAQSAAARSRSLQWYEGRRFRVDDARNTGFTKEQSAGRLPSGFDAGARNVSIFLSSEDEFVALAEWKHLFGESQEGTVASLISHPALDPAIRFWVRTHPNLRTLKNAQTARIDSLATTSPANTHVIPAVSDVDSYELMEQSDLVITFGSTVGPESIYWGTPVLLLGRATYESMDQVAIPASIDEAVDIINVGSPKPDRAAALGFGSLATETGHRFVRFDPGDDHRPTTFNGRSLRPPVPVLACLKVAYVTRRLTRRFGRACAPHSSR